MSPSTVVETPKKILPPLRKKVFKNSLVVVGIFVFIGLFMTAAVYLVSEVNPKLIHSNYDSIAAAYRMQALWAELRNSDRERPELRATQIAAFDQSLQFEIRNLTEPAEEETIKSIIKIWNEFKVIQKFDSRPAESQMVDYLAKIIQLNEKGMMNFVTQSSSISFNFFIGSLILFALGVGILFYLADELAVTISAPLKELALALRRKPTPGIKLILPEPNSLEMRILNHEMSKLWERLAELQKLNIEEFSFEKKKLESVLASVVDAILVLDSQQNVIHCNTGILDLIDLDADNVLGQSWSDLSSVSSNYIKLREVVRPEMSDNQIIELEVKNKSRLFSGHCRPFHAEGQATAGSIYLFTDTTRIRQRDRFKSKVMEALSHELKTYLLALTQTSDLLFAKKTECDLENQTLIDAVRKDCENLRYVVEEFVQVELVDLHSLELKVEKIPIEPCLERWIKPFQLLAKEANITMELVKEGSENIFTNVDTIKFPWVIYHLLLHAIENSVAGQTIKVYLTDREQRVDIEIQDEGPTITEDMQKKMSEEDSRCDLVKKTVGKESLGLGIAMTKELMAAHHGQIEYFSRGPTGSVFRISLPLAN